MSNHAATTLVSLQHSTGVQITAQIPVEKHSTRLQTRAKTLMTYISQYPSGWKKRLELADILYRLGKWSQAIQEYQQVLDRQPQLLEIRLRVGTLLHLLNRSGEAIALYQSALALETDAATCHHIQGLIHKCEASDAMVTLAFQKAIDAEPSNMAHWHAIAQSYARQDEWVKSIEAYDHILELNPDDAIAISRSADLLWDMEAYEASIKRSEKVLSLMPEHAPVLKRMIDHRCRVGLLKGEEGIETKRLLKKFQKLAPETPEFIQSQAYYYWYKGQVSKGKSLFAQYCQKYPANPLGLYYNALFLFHIGKLESSANYIWDAYQLYPEHINIFEALCEILPRVHRVTSVDLACHQKLSSATKHWKVHLIAGQFLAKYHHDPQRSRQLGKYAVELKPNLAQAWFQYGEILALCQDFQAAIDAIATGWELLPQRWFCASSLSAAAKMAECHQVLGQTTDSEQWWKEVLMRSKRLAALFPELSSRWREPATDNLYN